MLTRVNAVSLPTEDLDPEYIQGLRVAISAAVGYGLAVIERGEERAPAPPPALLGQARLAARNAIGLDTVLRRYFAGHTLLGDYLVEEAERSGLDGRDLQRLLRAQATLFDRLLAAISEEHARELQGRFGTPEERRGERIERLLAGELIDTTGLGYDFGGHHLGVVAVGPGALSLLKEFAGVLDCRLLSLRRREETVWAWLGARRLVDTGELQRLISAGRLERLTLALGEPGVGLAGWRLTHRQAKAALPIALRGEGSPTRYGEVALLTSIYGDDLLTTSLRQLYLAPLAEERDGGETLRETLRAYFRADCNASSAAAAMGVNRDTIANRLHTVERRLGRPLSACATEMKTALRLEALGYGTVRNRTQAGSAH